MENIRYSPEIDAILSVGLSLSEFGINSWALTKEQALAALQKFKLKGIPILGLDVLKLENGIVDYTYDSSCYNRSEGESLSDYINNSINRAINYIKAYPSEIALFDLVPDAKWHSSISDIMMNFRNALISIVPQLEVVHIGWKDDEQYDDYDNIAECLFENLVTRNLKYNTDLVLTGYGFVKEDYKRKSYIAINIPEIGVVPFIQFKTVNEAFDNIEIAILKDEVPSEFRVLSLNGLEDKFLFVLNKGIHKDLIYSVSIEL